MSDTTADLAVRARRLRRDLDDQPGGPAFHPSWATDLRDIANAHPDARLGKVLASDATTRCKALAAIANAVADASEAVARLQPPPEWTMRRALRSLPSDRRKIEDTCAAWMAALEGVVAVVEQERDAKSLVIPKDDPRASRKPRLWLAIQALDLDRAATPPIYDRFLVETAYARFAMLDKTCQEWVIPTFHDQETVAGQAVAKASVQINPHCLKTALKRARAAHVELAKKMGEPLDADDGPFEQWTSAMSDASIAVNRLVRGLEAVADPIRV